MMTAGASTYCGRWNSTKKTNLVQSYYNNGTSIIVT